MLQATKKTFLLNGEHMIFYAIFVSASILFADYNSFTSDWNPTKSNHFKMLNNAICINMNL